MRKLSLFSTDMLELSLLNEQLIFTDNEFLFQYKVSSSDYSITHDVKLKVLDLLEATKLYKIKLQNLKSITNTTNLNSLKIRALIFDNYSFSQVIGFTNDSNDIFLNSDLDPIKDINKYMLNIAENEKSQLILKLSDILYKRINIKSQLDKVTFEYLKSSNENSNTNNNLLANKYLELINELMECLEEKSQIKLVLNKIFDEINKLEA